MIHLNCAEGRSFLLKILSLYMFFLRMGWKQIFPKNMK